jgi:hypothetical protein
MKKIPLSQNKFALVDDEDFDFLNQWKWYFCNGYAMRNKPKVNGKSVGLIRMHRVINNTAKGLFTDHINRNKLDNRKSNLRSVNKSLNEHNTGVRKNNKYGFKNIIWENRRGMWRVEIMINRKKFFLGYFNNLRKAISTRDSFRKDYCV